MQPDYRGSPQPHEKKPILGGGGSIPVVNYKLTSIDEQVAENNKWLSRQELLTTNTPGGRDDMLPQRPAGYHLVPVSTPMPPPRKESNRVIFT